MKTWKVILPVAALLLFAGQAAAQTDDDERASANGSQGGRDRAETSRR